MTTLLALILAIPIGPTNIPHPDRYGGTVQVWDIVSPWVGAVPPVTNGADAWIQEQKNNVKFHTPPGQLRRPPWTPGPPPWVPEPATVLLLGGGWWWVRVNRDRIRR